MMSWYQRKEKGITTPTSAKKETPDNLWYKCPNCKYMMTTRDHKLRQYTCVNCNYHERVGANLYFEILFDKGEYTELDADLVAADPLSFTDSKPYPERVKAAQAKTNLKDALRSAHGKMNKLDLVVACMDFRFIGGSMGSVVGEKIARAADYALKNKIPLLVISRSGGARMMEAGFSLMQMAKTSAKLALLAEAKIPYISLMTDPTTGGVSASFAMQGDFNIAEPNALIGFAGPRVIRETIGKDLPKGFQIAESVMEQGFLDFIVHRRDLKDKLTALLKMLQ